MSAFQKKNPRLLSDWAKWSEQAGACGLMKNATPCVISTKVRPCRIRQGGRTVSSKVSLRHTSTTSSNPKLIAWLRRWCPVTMGLHAAISSLSHLQKLAHMASRKRSAYADTKPTTWTTSNSKTGRNPMYSKVGFPNEDHENWLQKSAQILAQWPQGGDKEGLDLGSAWNLLLGTCGLHCVDTGRKRLSLALRNRRYRKKTLCQEVRQPRHIYLIDCATKRETCRPNS